MYKPGPKDPGFSAGGRMKKRFGSLTYLEALTELPKEEPGTEEYHKSLAQPGLHELRKKIKEAMIPLLIQIFHLKQAKEEKPQEKEILVKLNTLKEDLHHLSLWCTSCLNQIDKALAPNETRQRACSVSKKSSLLHFSHLFFSDPERKETTAGRLLARFQLHSSISHNESPSLGKKLFSLVCGKKKSKRE